MDTLRDAQLAVGEQFDQREEKADRFRADMIAVAGSVAVPNRTRYVWIKIGGLVSQAFNLAVQVRENQPIWVILDPAGEYVVEKLDASRLKYLADWDGDPGLANHHGSHEPGGADPVDVYTRMLVALRTYVDPGNATLSVSVAPYGDFPGRSTLDLSSHQPAAGLARYVLVYLDTADNQVKTVAGTTTADVPTLKPAKPALPEGGVASAYVRIDGSQTAITEEDIVDARQILNALITYIRQSLIDAKGDLIVGTADNQVARLPVGTNGKKLVADSSQSTGLAWVADAAASETVAGIAELATQAEVDAGTDDGRIMTPLKLRSTPTGLIRIKNTSGATAAMGDVGYIDEVGEYKTTTTEAAQIEWVVVIAGGANNADIYVVDHGRVVVNYTGTDPTAGQYLITSTSAGSARAQATMRPEIFAVCVGNGSGGQVEALLLCNTKMVFSFNSNNLFRVDNASNSDFVSTIATLPGAGTLTYGVVTAGAADCLVPTATNQLAKLTLHNTTRGTSALILNCVTGTSTITLTGNVPAGWQVGDAITIRSQINTNTIVLARFVDLEVVSGINLLCRGLSFSLSLSDSGSGDLLGLVHPWENGTGAKRLGQVTQVANVDNRVTVPLPLLRYRFCALWQSSGVSTASYVLKMAVEWRATP